MRRKSGASSRAPDGAEAPTELIFRQAAASSGVRPLAPSRQRIPKNTPRPAASAHRPSFTVSGDADRLEGYRSKLGPSALDRLRGTPAATLDLHRLKAAQAQARLLAFLEAERAHARRLVLVIVGKGRHSPGGQGILRAEIADWLAASPHVLAFETAPPRLGGDGAVLVALA